MSDPEGSASAQSHPRSAWAVAIGLGILPLVGFWAFGLFDLDEGFYAAVVAEMNLRGEWITPYYNGRPWFEKPVLLYWAAKPTVAMFYNEFGARLPSVLATLCSFAVCSRFLAKRGYGRASLLVIPILGSCLLFVGAGRMMLTDPLLALLVAGSFLSFFLSLEGDRRWKWLAGGLLGVTVLAKGPVALPVFVALAIWTYIEDRDLRPRFRGGWLIGTLLFCAAVAAWYLPAWLISGDVFVQKFLIEQNVGRFLGGDTHHNMKILNLRFGDLVMIPIYYPLVLLLGMLPWSLVAWKGRPRRGEDDLVKRFLWRWAIAWVVFFSLSGSKLPHYILPAIVPLAMLAAIRIADLNPKKLPTAAWVTPIVVFVLLNAAIGFYYQWSGHSEVHALALQVKNDPVPVAAYQLPRREGKKRPDGVPVNETSHPSLVFYLGRTYIEAETLDDLVNAPKPLWVVTRSARITPADEDVLRSRGVATESVSQGRYSLYKLESR